MKGECCMSAIPVSVLSEPMPPGVPSLDNQSAGEWEAYRELAYVFARHVRHDLVNVQCSLQLIDVVAKMRELGGDVPLPPELSDEQVQIKVKQAIKQIASMSNDLVLLSQATTPAAYRHAHTLTVAELLESALGSRQGEGGTWSNVVAGSPVAGARLMAMGDMLQAAAAACCFQWTPWLHPPAEPICGLAATDQALLLSFPVIDAALAAGFTQKLALLPGAAVHPVLQEALTTTTSEFALWLARFIITLHGGSIALVPGRGGQSLQVNLPLSK